MSEVRVTTLKDTAGANSSTTAEIASGRAKSWVNFNGASTVAIRANFNVNSITDNGTGDYTVNFSNALTDANYCVAHHVGNYNEGGTNSTVTGARPHTNSSSSYRFSVNFAEPTSNSLFDYSMVCISIFR